MAKRDDIDELLDDERPLTEEERRALAAEDDSLAEDLRALGAEPPPPSFTAEVMQEVEERRVSRFVRLRDAVIRPRLVRLNVALALGSAAAVAAALWVGLSGGASRRDVVRAPEPPPAPAEAPGENEAMVSFRLAAPGARSVAVAGDFNAWQVGATLLVDDDGDGIWTATVAIARGRHAYMFVVDGREWVLDPAAEAIQPDGFGGTNAVLRL